MVYCVNQPRAGGEGYCTAPDRDNNKRVGEPPKNKIDFDEIVWASDQSF